jgi:hypothetical protein
LLIINLIQEHTKDYVQSSWNIHEFESLLTKRWVNIYETLTEKEERQKVEAEKQQEKVSDNSQQTNNSRYNLDKNWNLTFVSWSWEKVNVQLSPAEQHLIEHNPSMRRNIIRFNRVLYSSGLGKLWNFRHEIFKWIANIKWVSFDAFDENYLSRNEMKIFMNAILKSVWKQEINVDMANMRGFIWQVKDENGRNAFWKTATDFSWKSDIEKEFLEKFVSNGIFNLIAFEETLKSSPKNDEK